MGKSLGNYVGVGEPANEQFGKVMSIPDELMKEWFELLTDRRRRDCSVARPREDETDGREETSRS